MVFKAMDLGSPDGLLTIDTSAQGMEPNADGVDRLIPRLPALVALEQFLQPHPE